MDRNDPYSFANRTESHIFGKTVTNKTMNLLASIVARPMAGIHIFCFRSKTDVDIAYKAMAYTDKGYNAKYVSVNNMTPLEEAVKVPYLFCTPSKLCHLVIHLWRNNLLGHLTWVTIDGWDRYDANEFAAVGLLHAFRENYKYNYRVTMLSVSAYAELPVFKEGVYPKMEVVTPKIEVRYEAKQTPSQVLMEQLAKLQEGERIIFYSGNEKLVKDKRVIEATYPTRVPDVTHVVDTLWKPGRKPITKHVAELRADSINAGSVIRCAAKGQFDKLRDNSIPDRYNLDRVIFFLYSTLRDVNLADLFPKDHALEIKRILGNIQRYRLAPEHVSYILSTGLSLIPGIFLYDWNKEHISRGKDIARSKFVGSLFACLIEHPPLTYAPLSAFKAFKGRNDLETMVNVWASLQTSVSIFQTPNERNIAAWCDMNNFFVDTVSKLFRKMHKILHFSIPELREGRLGSSPSLAGPKGTGRIARQLQDPVTTNELNLATLILGRYFPETIRASLEKWDMSDAKAGRMQFDDVLPRSAQNSDATAKNILIIHAKGNRLQMYIGAMMLEDIPIIYAPSDFSDIMSAYPELFK